MYETEYKMDRKTKFLTFLQGIKSHGDVNTSRIIDSLSQGFEVCFEGHSGFDRTIEKIAVDAGLEFSKWDNYLKREVGAGIKNIIYPRKVLGFSKDEDAQRKLTETKNWLRKLNAINYEFTEPSVIDVRPSDFSNKTDDNAYEMVLNKVSESGEAKSSENISSYSALRSRLFNEMRIDDDKHKDSIGEEEKRHLVQKKLIGQTGINKEPIVLIRTSDGKLNIHEGWHRLIRLFKNQYNKLLPEYLEKYYDVDEYNSLGEKDKVAIRLSMFTQMFEMNDEGIKVNAYIGKHKPLQEEQISILKRVIGSVAKKIGVGKEAQIEKSIPKPSSFKDTMKDT